MPPYPTIENPVNRARSARILMCLWSLLIFSEPALAFVDSSPELDVTKIGLRLRSEVVQLLGPPTRSTSPDQDSYAWGFVEYTKGKAGMIDYSFTVRARSVREALARVGLTETSSPRKGPFSYFWNPSTGSLICCSFEMDNVVISGDFSGIAIGFKE